MVKKLITQSSLKICILIQLSIVLETCLIVGSLERMKVLLSIRFMYNSG